jgi:uncharacterized RDD family membrane protein YckC
VTAEAPVSFASDVAYAELWRRVAAAIVDVAVLAVLSFVLGVVAGLLAFGLFGDAALDGLERFLSGPARTPLALVVFWLYFAPLESSRLQASLGKRLLGLRVTDLDERRLSFLRATGRFLGKLLSVATLLIGFLLAAFTARRQALHDLVAGCLVLRRE